MHSIGADLHKKSITMHVVNQARITLASKRLDCRDTKGILEWLQRFRPFQMTVEATASYEWFVQLVEPLADRVVLAHPGKLRVIAESTRKSDKLDAKVLAEFLALDMIPPAYRPTPRQREHRSLLRQRDYLRRCWAKVKNRIRRIFSDHNADEPGLFNRRRKREEHPALALMSNAERLALQQLWQQSDLYREQITQMDEALAGFAESAPPAEAVARQVLRSIPGVGPITSEAFLCEIGDVRRFSSQKKLAAYAGVAPGQRESAGKKKELGITHRGSKLLRWTLNQAAWQLQRRDLHWKKIFEAIAKRRGRKRAITALSRRLLCVMAALVTQNQTYRRTGLAVGVG